jgi:hypothetical protein
MEKNPTVIAALPFDAYLSLCEFRSLALEEAIRGAEGRNLPAADQEQRLRSVDPLEKECLAEGLDIVIEGGVYDYQAGSKNVEELRIEVTPSFYRKLEAIYRQREMIIEKLTLEEFAGLCISLSLFKRIDEMNRRLNGVEEELDLEGCEEKFDYHIGE